MAATLGLDWAHFIWYSGDNLCNTLRIDSLDKTENGSFCRRPGEDRRNGDDRRVGDALTRRVGDEWRTVCLVGDVWRKVRRVGEDFRDGEAERLVAFLYEADDIFYTIKFKLIKIYLHFFFINHHLV